MERSSKSKAQVFVSGKSCGSRYIVAYFLKQLQQHIDKGIITMTEEQHRDWLMLRYSTCITWTG
ncbi:MAG: hypothetical protein WKG06_37005 [Segetibacter sp.]